MEAGAQPLTIEPTAEERRLGRLLEPNIRAAMVGLEEEGVVVIKQVVDRRHCAALLERILSDYRELEVCDQEWKLEQQPPGQFWQNWQGGRPPPCHPFLFPDVAFNEFVLSVTQRILGPLGDGGLVGSYGLMNTSFADRLVPYHGDQAPHVDANCPYEPHRTAVPPPESFSINLPLLNQTDETGATVYWPGTHKDLGLWHGLGRGGVAGRPEGAPELRTQGRFPSEAMLRDWEACRGEPKRTYVEVGDAIIRNPRVWHRGTANRSHTHRPMVSVGQSVWRQPRAAAPEFEVAVEKVGAVRPEWQRQLFGRELGSFTAPLDTETFWRQHPTLRYNPLFVPGEVDYKCEQRYYGPAFTTEGRGGVVPGYFMCPASGALMRDPVTTRSGATCERRAVIEILRATGGVDPFNFPAAADVGEDALRPNKKVAADIKAWRATGSVARL